jgi:hypothetical protein
VDAAPDLCARKGSAGTAAHNFDRHSHDLAAETIAKHTNILEYEDIKLAVDPLSEMYLLGTTIDYIKEDYERLRLGSNFEKVVENVKVAPPAVVKKAEAKDESKKEEAKKAEVVAKLKKKEAVVKTEDAKDKVKEVKKEESPEKEKIKKVESAENIESDQISKRSRSKTPESEVSNLKTDKNKKRAKSAKSKK